jgi:hypothetical protein
MKYLKIFKMATRLFIHTFEHLSTQDVKWHDTINADISWTIQRKPDNEKT